MKRIFKTKNLLFLFMLTVLLLTGTMLFKAPSANAAVTDTVSMYYDDANCVYHGGYIHTIYIKVANLNYEKNVSVNYIFSSSPDNEWQTSDAQYVTSLDSNYDIFKVSISGFGLLKYYINYTVNGTTYTDNNNGSFYEGQKLGSAYVCAVRSYGGLSSYEIKAAVKNLGYDKDVKVVYTTDNWATSKEASLSYSNTADNNAEIWYTYLDLSDAASIDDFKYAISYTVNGTTYWDNNFGNNYDSNYHSEY